MLLEVSHEQEEPDSAFEATQYFFEDITPDTSMGETSSLYNRLVMGFELEDFHTFSALQFGHR